MAKPTRGTASRPTAFWLVKGNKNYPTSWDRRDGDIRAALEESQAEGTWATGHPIPADFDRGHGIFYWSSSPDCFVIGLGMVVDPDTGTDGEYNTFQLSFLEGPFERTITLAQLRETLPPRADGVIASFLRPGDARTIYTMAYNQTQCFARQIVRSDNNRQLAEHRLQDWGLL